MTSLLQVTRHPHIQFLITNSRRLAIAMTAVAIAAAPLAWPGYSHAAVGGKRAAVLAPFTAGATTGNESPSVHNPQSSTYAMAWDMHGGASTSVYPRIVSSDGPVTMRISALEPTSAGYRVDVEVKVSNVYVGTVRYSHLASVNVNNQQLGITNTTQLGSTAPNQTFPNGGEVCYGFACSSSWQVHSLAGIHTHMSFAKGCYGPQGISSPVGASEGIVLLSQNYDTDNRTACDNAELAAVANTCSTIGSSARSDVDRNGGADLFLLSRQATGSSGTARLSTYTSFIPSQFNWNGASYNWATLTPLVGDVNGDQRADYVYLVKDGSVGTKAFVATSNGTSFNTPQLWWNGAGWGYGGIKAALGDVDNNGGEDLVLTVSKPNGSDAFVLLSTYANFMAPQPWWDGTAYGWSGITPLVGDVNGDRRADYVVLTNEGANGTKAFVATSNGTRFGFAQLWWDGLGWGYSGIKPSLGDVDRNGGVDLVLTTSEPSGAAAYALTSTYGTFQAPKLWWNGVGFGWSGITPLVGDVKGDRMADYTFLTNEGANGTKAFVATSTCSDFAAPQQWWSSVQAYTDLKAYLK
jgi:hypothetical protein